MAYLTIKELQERYPLTAQDMVFISARIARGDIGCGIIMPNARISLSFWSEQFEVQALRFYHECEQRRGVNRSYNSQRL